MNPLLRLEALEKDEDQPQSRRTEARAAQTLYRDRTAALDDRIALSEPEIIPIGMLMLVPGDAHGI
jgi:hypothetical protein